MSITRLYIVVMFGAGADWKNARVNVSYCTLRGVSWRNRHLQRKEIVTYTQIQFWQQEPTKLKDRILIKDVISYKLKYQTKEAWLILQLGIYFLFLY